MARSGRRMCEVTHKRLAKMKTPDIARSISRSAFDKTRSCRQRGQTKVYQRVIGLEPDPAVRRFLQEHRIGIPRLVSSIDLGNLRGRQQGLARSWRGRRGRFGGISVDQL